MKSIIYKKFGNSDVLELNEHPLLQVSDDEVLIKIQATSINSGDLHMRSGKPFIARLFAGPIVPRSKILGTTFSGQVAEIGSKVTQFDVGDDVFGSLGNRFGTHTQYLTIKENGALVKKDERLSHSEATVISFGPQTALYFLNKIKEPLENKKMLVIGGSGRVGSYMIQLAKHRKMQVTTVTSKTKEAFVKSLGSDNIIDYKSKDITKLKETYDVILDTTGKYPLRKLKRLLTSKGSLIALALTPSLVFNMLTSPFSSKKIIFDVSKVTRDNLNQLSDLIINNKLKINIEKEYALEDFKAAHEKAESGNNQGSIILRPH